MLFRLSAWSPTEFEARRSPSWISGLATISFLKEACGTTFSVVSSSATAVFRRGDKAPVQLLAVNLRVVRAPQDLTRCVDLFLD